METTDDGMVLVYDIFGKQLEKDMHTHKSMETPCQRLTDDVCDKLMSCLQKRSILAGPGITT